ncbi:MAG: metallophosphoesterase [Bacteroidales bacterium]|nr:metallophosphoesterase [Bacteroidales bacterium]
MGSKVIAILFLMFFAIIFTSCEYDVDLSGLIRSTDRVEKRFEESMQWNINNPCQTLNVTKENYQILVAADSHIGGMLNFSYLKNLYQQSDYLAFVIVGDIVSGKEEDYLLFMDSISDITKPLFPIVGNHDLYFDGWKYFYKYLGSSTYYFTVETPTFKDIYLCLDNSCGTFGKSQIHWLEQFLKDNRKDYRYCTVFSHVNILRTRRTTSANPMTEEVVYLLDLFAKNNIDFVITGHDHVQDEKTFGNTSYIILDALKDDNKNAGYGIMNISNTDISHEFVRLK